MIIVTAGHVDHGKTSLLQALTGTHTAHLPEERKRGLTIDLGYAYLPFDGGAIGFIDVPGHQRFLSNMLAGLGGINHALLVVSAEEGIKPQTDEHLHILKLLHFQQIIVVLTKADRVNDAQLDALTVKLKTKYPFLARSPFFITSTVSKIGIESLKHYLIQLNTSSHLLKQPFRYAIDRVFNIKGAGLVVTGTAITGNIKVGDEFYLSSGQKVRIKKIHAQNMLSDRGIAEQRLALNIANIEKEKIKRGDWITQLPPRSTDRISLYLTAQERLKESQVVHIYHFAKHITGKLTLLTRKHCEKDQKVLAELILDEPLYIAIDDKLIMRSGDNQYTLAGGNVLEIDSPKRHKRSEPRLNYLKMLAENRSLPQRLSLYLQQSAQIINNLAWNEQQFNEELIKNIDQIGGEKIEDFVFSEEYHLAVETKLLEKLAEFHQAYQDQLGLTKARLYRIAALNQPEKLVYAFIDNLISKQKITQTRGWIHLIDHKIELSEIEDKQWQEIKKSFEQTHQALWVRDLAEIHCFNETEMRNMLYKLGKLGYLIPIVKDRFLLSEQIKQFAHLIKNYIEQNGNISVNQLRDEIHYGRKLTVQLIEYFDRVGFLRRKGNVHLLRDADIFD